MTTAEQVYNSANDAVALDTLAHSKEAEVDNDWATETTTYTFSDGSSIAVSGPTFWVVE